MEVIPTGYILINSEVKTAVSRVTGTSAMSRNNIQLIVDTAKAGELLGMKLMYLEAGSGAKMPLNPEIITKVKQELKIPLIVGGGIRSVIEIENAHNAGADFVVIGTAFEVNEELLNHLHQ